MYRITDKAKARYSRMGEASVAKRAKMRGLNKDAFVPEIPELRKRITVEVFDTSGEPEKHVFELKKGKRIDMYLVYVDGSPWKHCGLSSVLSGIRKALPRTLSEASLYS